MNDFELNKAIAEFIYPDAVCICELNTGAAEIQKGKGDNFIIDYLVYWEDLMPLVIEHSIQLNTAYDKYEKHTAYHGRGLQFFQCNFVSHNKNPQRALAECLLKVLTRGEGDE